MPDSNKVKQKLIITQIVLDPEIDDDLLSTSIPKGYTVEDVSNITTDPQITEKLNSKTAELRVLIQELKKAVQEYQSIPKEQVEARETSFENMQRIQKQVELLAKEIKERDRRNFGATNDK